MEAQSGYYRHMTRLNTTTLPSLPPAVQTPAYSRTALAPAIVHLGVGGFHRAHEAVYCDDLLTQGTGDWGIVGVGLRPEDQAMRDALAPQDSLYTLVTRDAGGDTARVIGSLMRYLFAPDQGAEVRAALAAPTTKIVSLTITEGGYEDPTGPAWIHLAEALETRRASGTAPFTVLSCDNLQHNGEAARRALVAAASARDPELAAWVDANVAFPSAMVDRITPQTTDSDRALVRTEFGIDDAWPVVCEPFRQWIVEDTFPQGRPAWENAGAQFVSDVHPYESMKLGLLNGSHFAMAYLGFLAGYETVPAVMADPDFRQFISRLMDDEVTPLLPPVPGIDLTDYKTTLLHRFDNPAIKDQITRLCQDGAPKFPKYLRPALEAALATNRPRRLLTLALAGWLRYLTGEDEHGCDYTIQDPRAEELRPLARAGRTDLRPLLAVTDIFGPLGQSPQIVHDLAADLESLYAYGAQATLAAALKE